ncbi:Ig-like domain-containing protein [Mucilaginibacter agri]|uniref:Ig-like domain-containing protein n=1 Tax=Mucilaginibacter agri TaxID=2695265 RepID=UPI001AA153A0|nr:Ig-like domain-containing protein [Mucilaginibacter agri]
MADKAGIGTGFTVAMPYSGTRLSADGTASVSGVPGYEPSKLSITGGRLKLTTNKGIDYLTNNNQINILSVPVVRAGKLTVEVSLVNPLNGTSSQQAGLWYGLNDKYSLKLVCRANSVELHKEANDVSSAVAGTANTDQRISSTIKNLNLSTVRLRLVIDSAANSADGFYSLDGGATYINVGSSYPKTSVSIAGMGLTGTTAYAGIYATHRSASTAVTYTFDDFSVKNVVQNAPNFLKFSADSLVYTIYRGGAVTSQSTNLTANTGTPTITFSTLNATWLTAPAGKLGAISLGSANIKTDLDPGSYRGLIVANGTGYQKDTLVVKLVIVKGVTTNSVNINFQDPATIPPQGWVRDFGQAIGSRNGLYQSTGLTYGWRKRSDATPIDLTKNGFNRNTPEDITLATLIHMQASNIVGTFSGTKIQSYWEMNVPNGTYDVTVGVGDGMVDNATQSYNINVEGVKAIGGFVPTGNAGTSTRFKQTTVRVPVKDEYLTINADGGMNTRINFAQVVPVSISPYLAWSNNTPNILIQKGTKTPQTFSLNVSNSNNTSIQYSFAATYGAGATGWLSFKSVQTGITPLMTYDYSAAASLPVGTYTASVKASVLGNTSATMDIQLRVVDSLKPYVISSSPANGSVNVDINTVSVAANNLHVPVVSGFKGGVDNSTITSNTVKLFKVVDTTSTLVQGLVQGTGGGDAISFSPLTQLLPNTMYKFVISSGVKSYSGAAFAPFTSTFVTGNGTIDSSSIVNAQFTKVAIPGTQKKNYTTLRFGPDHKLYALRLDGSIERYAVDPTSGMLTNQEIISTLVTIYGKRSAIGLVFDPASTANNLICYVTHSSSGLINSPAFDGNISKLSGPSLGTEQLLVTKLPRSTRDHMANSLAFGPDGALYMCQGSNSSAGAFDNDWQRSESLLSGTILRIDMAKLKTLTLPLNVQTTATLSVINAAPSNNIRMSDGTYNPYSTLSPVTIYASGVRNAFDLVWHSNGQLYLPTNGSGGGGNSPASVAGTRRPDGTFYNGPDVPATTGIQVQKDWLFRVNPLKGVGYYGHPNPLRGEYVENRGVDDNPLYPAGTVADASYRGYAYDFGLNHSPDGAIEYKSNTFNGALKNKLLVCRFSGGGDIVVMEPGSKVAVPGMTASSNDAIYDIVKVTTGSGNMGLVGMSGFANPINLEEDPLNGNLYVIEYNWNTNPNLLSQITLLKVNTTNAAPAAIMNVTATKTANIEGLISYKNYEVTLMNKGDGVLNVKDISITGPAADEFSINGIPMPDKNNPLTMKPNSSLTFGVNAPAFGMADRVVKLSVTSVEDSVKEVELRLAADNNYVTLSADSASLKSKLPDSDNLSLVLYPNPTTVSQVKVQIKNFEKSEDLTISLYDINGRKLKSLKGRTGLDGTYATTIQLPVNNNAHVYIVRAVSPTVSKEAKLIVK